MMISSARHTLCAAFELWEISTTRFDILYEGAQGESYVWGVYKGIYPMEAGWPLPFDRYISLLKL